MAKTQRNSVAEYVERWIRGESLAVLARESGMKRSKFRRELTKAVGGKERYRELRSQGAGGSSKLAPRRRGSGGPLIDDSGVPVIPNARGWKSRIVYVNRYSTSVFIDPDGVEYVNARDNEKADLIVDFDLEGKGYKLGKARLRRLDQSSVGRKLKKERKSMERGQAALERQREQRRQKRAARRKGGTN